MGANQLLLLAVNRKEERQNSSNVVGQGGNGFSRDTDGLPAPASGLGLFSRRSGPGSVSGQQDEESAAEVQDSVEEKKNQKLTCWPRTRRPQ